MTAPAPPPDAGADEDARRIEAIAALLAPVPLVPIPTAPQWHDAKQRVLDPKSLY